MAKMAVAKHSDRGLTWTHDETRALIRIWADSEIQKDNATKTENSKSGMGRKSSAYFEEMDQVLGHRPASAPPVLIDTMSRIAKRKVSCFFDC